jgi:mannose-6-phosphate isomerase class I
MISPFYLIPLLVEQPTWGGKYIAEFKNISSPDIRGRKIGQSFELYGDGFITTTFQNEMPYAYATAGNWLSPQFFNKPDDLQSLQMVINQNPETILGRRVIEKYGANMRVLIKFTQAQNNSYQVHVCSGKEFGQWLAKPESWYFLENGKATLGLKPNIDPQEYKLRCSEIYSYAQQLSAQVRAGEIHTERAKGELKRYIQERHPEKFVNTVFITKNQVVDLSKGGIHHSWEMGEEIPNGNIVYEVQQDVMDEYCTLRSFDQGNMKDDGTVRPLTIEEYFEALNKEPTENNPDNYIKTPSSRKEADAVLTKLFENESYKTISIQFSGMHSGEHTTLQGSFHHVFVQSGSIYVQVDGKKWQLEKGWSLFVPANIQKYLLVSSNPATVLVTSV